MMKKLLLFLCTLIFLLSSVIPPIHVEHINSYAGPFNIVYKKIERCPTQISGKDYVQVHLISTYDRTTKLQRFIGNVTLKIPVDQSMGATIAMASYDRVTGWKSNAFRLPIGRVATAFYKYLPETTDGMLKGLQNGPDKLPIPAGTYKFNGTLQETDIKMFKVFPYGQYRDDLMTYDLKSPKETTGCIRMFLDVVPKRT